MGRLLAELIDYYHQCLLQERRETLSILASRLEQSVLPLEEGAHESWRSLNTLPRAGVRGGAARSRRDYGCVCAVGADHNARYAL